MKLISRSVLSVLMASLLLGASTSTFAITAKKAAVVSPIGVSTSDTHDTNKQGEGKHGGYGHPANATHLAADLTAATGVGQGELDFTTSTDHSDLRGGLTLSVGSATLDSNAAVAATVTLTLAGSTCTLKPAHIRFQYPTTGVTEEIDYAINGKQDSATNTTAFKIGGCSGTTLPVIAAGDTATVTVVSAGKTITTLTGSFK